MIHRFAVPCGRSCTKRFRSDLMIPLFPLQSAPFSTNTDEDSPSHYGVAAHRYRSRLDAAAADSAPCVSPTTMLSHAGLPLHNSAHPTDMKNYAHESNSNEPLSPPLHLATTYSRPASGNYNDANGGKGQIYGRTDNATREILEQTVGALELMPYPRSESDDRIQPKAATDIETVACSSGMAAISTLLLAHPTPVHVILPEDVYHGVPTLLHTVLQHHGMRFSSVDMRDVDKVEQAVRECATQGSDSNGEKGAVVLWMESPSNPLLNVADVSALTSLVDRIRGDVVQESSSFPRMISTVVDSTLFPPPLSCPLLSGADFVVHSATKYLGGHSDALLGVVTASPFSGAGRTLASRIRQVQQVTGCQASAFDSWLVLRGMRTLHVRVERQCKTALKVAQFLEKQALVTKVHYPGLSSHPDHHLATQTMPKGLYGGVLSFEVTDARYAMAVAGAVRVIERGTSLGGTETLIEHRASIEPEDRRVSPPGLLRMSIGLEAAEDLIADLERALHVAEQVVQ